MEQETLKPRTIFCHDNLPILRGINSNSIDLIYLDPPFNKGKKFHAPIGTTAEGATFTDIWSQDSVKDEWHNQINERYPQLYEYLNAIEKIGSKSAKYYLIYMAVRLMEMQRILKNNGSIYLHCDSTASHYLKLLMDVIFGRNNFRNEIIWRYGKMSNSANNFPNNHETILRYSKTKEVIFKRIKEDDSEYRIRFKNFLSGDNTIKYGSVKHKKDKLILNRAKRLAKKLGRELNDDDVLYDFSIEFKVQSDVIYVPIVKGNAKQRKGYPTQKPVKLLCKIIEASSNKGDIVLDPFCGCATTCIAAEQLQRKWVGIDVSSKAYELVQMRLDNEMPADLERATPIFRDDILRRTDVDYNRKISKEDKKYLFAEQNAKCKGCATSFEIQHLQVDHIIPRAHGGGNNIENLQLLCGSCNSIKGDRPMEYLKDRLRQYLKENYGNP